MAGRHRRRRPSVWRRLLQAAAVGSAAAMLGTALAVLRREAVFVEPEPPVMEVTAEETTTTLPVVPFGVPASVAAAARSAATPPPDPPPTTPPPARRAAPEPPVTPVARDDCPTSGWGVKPHVAQVGHHVAAVFGLTTGSILGLGRRGNASDHPSGLALDFMTSSSRVGDQIAAYVLLHRADWGVTYVIWRQRINYGSGWQPMEDRGSVTANHYDHVHVSFAPRPGGTSPTC